MRRLAPHEAQNCYQFRSEKAKDATESVKVGEINYIIVQAGTTDDTSELKLQAFTTSRSYYHDLQPLTFNDQLEDPMVLLNAPLVRGNDPAAIRYQNLQSGSVMVRTDEPTGWDEAHTTEEVSALIIEVPSHEPDVILTADGLQVSRYLSIGASASASGDNSIAVGTNALASAHNSVAIGENAQSLSDNSLAIGANAVADTDTTLAVDGNVNISGNLTVSGETNISGPTQFSHSVLVPAGGDISMGAFQ